LIRTEEQQAWKTFKYNKSSIRIANKNIETLELYNIKLKTIKIYTNKCIWYMVYGSNILNLYFTFKQVYFLIERISIYSFALKREKQI